MQYGPLKKLMVALLLLPAVYVMAQPNHTQTPTSKPVFHALIHSGLLAGSSSRDVQVQATAALEYKNWQAGIGTGVDYYLLRSIPIFFEARKLFQTPIPLFVYAGAGCNVPWIKEDKNITWYTIDFKTGFYYDAGVGWHHELKNRHAILLSAGYSEKKLTEMQTFPVDGTTSRFDYNLRRLSFKIGFQF